MAALPKTPPNPHAEPQRAAPQATAAVTLAWIRALASDWTEKRENEDRAPSNSGSRRR